jgi:Reverse transcriptase (RNA-dependent DNA polymerase)
MVTDFHPISIINLFPKLVSKVLATRLSRFLPELISRNQTSFIKGRQIAENFIATRELLHHVHATNSRAIFMKIDFAKAFDSVTWQFLQRVMQARGFPTRWIVWIDNILSSSSSRVVLNGEVSRYFFFIRKGLRQGDPLSPMLFLLAADVHQMMLQNSNRFLHEK